MCTQSLVINGRYDKKGNLEEGYGAPIGSSECLRLVRDFQGNDDATDAEVAHEAEVQELREQQNRVESGLIQRVVELEQQIEERHEAPAPRPRVTQQTVQQPVLNTSQRSKMAELFPEKEENSE
jgi:hypothetical protein